MARNSVLSPVMFCVANQKECKNPGGIGMCGNCDVPEHVLREVFELARNASGYNFKGNGNVAIGSYQQGDRRIVNRIAGGEIVLPESSL